MKNRTALPQMFYKKFSVGVFLDTSLGAFESFVEEYAEFIDNFYFSLPMGDKFHSRKRVVEQFRNQDEIEKFWKILDIVKKYGIRLELLFNTGNISEHDIMEAKSFLDSHRIEPQLVGIINEYYDIVRRVFPQCEIVYSFNNRPKNYSDYNCQGHQYSGYVIGRNYIRDKALYKYIHQELHSRTILLVNNGCSHICGGCDTLQHCKDSYFRAAESHSSEYLYALQSIMPFELREGHISLMDIDYIKINSRNADLNYVRKCLHSYIFGHEEDWIALSENNYSLWAHLTWHMAHYLEFDLDNIIQTKKEFYSQQNEGQKNLSDISTDVLFYGNENVNLLYLSPYTQYWYSDKTIQLKNRNYDRYVTIPLNTYQQRVFIRMLKAGVNYEQLLMYLRKNRLDDEAFESLLQGCVIE